MLLSPSLSLTLLCLVSVSLLPHSVITLPSKLITGFRFAVLLSLSSIYCSNSVAKRTASIRTVAVCSSFVLLCTHHSNYYKQRLSSQHSAVRVKHNNTNMVKYFLSPPATPQHPCLEGKALPRTWGTSPTMQTPKHSLKYLNSLACLTIYLTSSLWCQGLIAHLTNLIHYPPLLISRHLFNKRLCKYKCSTSKDPSAFQLLCLVNYIQHEVTISS